MYMYVSTGIHYFNMYVSYTYMYIHNANLNCYAYVCNFRERVRVGTVEPLLLEGGPSTATAAKHMESQLWSVCM